MLLRSKDGWYRIKKANLDNRFKGWDWRGLLDVGLLIRKDGYTPGSKSLRYRIPEHILEGWTQAHDFLEGDSGYVNLMTGKPWSEADEVALQAENVKEWEGFPERMQKAAQVFQESYFNHRAVVEHIERLKLEFAKLSPSDEEYETKKGELLNDELCFAAIYAQAIGSPDSNGIQVFRPCYLPASTGRIQMVGGGLQSCTREMKLAAYGSLEGMRNYDLSSSQARIALEEFRRWDIECPWLEDYLHNPHRRQECYEYVGIPKDIWKQSLSALLMGAKLPSLSELQEGRRQGDIVKVLRRRVTPDPVELEGIITRLWTVVDPLIPPLRKWHSKILEDFRCGETVQNAMGLKIHYTDLRKGESKRGKVAAHILQGIEAYFIQELTLLSTKYGYKPIANEHDGLVVIGEIPPEAVEEAKAITGLHYMELEEKPDFGASSKKEEI